MAILWNIGPRRFIIFLHLRFSFLFFIFFALFYFMIFHDFKKFIAKGILSGFFFVLCHSFLNLQKGSQKGNFFVFVKNHFLHTFKKCIINGILLGFFFVLCRSFLFNMQNGSQKGKASRLWWASILHKLFYCHVKIFA